MDRANCTTCVAGQTNTFQEIIGTMCSKFPVKDDDTPKPCMEMFEKDSVSEYKSSKATTKMTEGSIIC